MSSIVLTLRTDNPQAEIGLYSNENQTDYVTWHAHRQLAETIHGQIKNLLDKHNLGFGDLSAIVAYEGPGSFTGLRIGLSVVNALASSYDIPAVGATGDEWQRAGIKAITDQQDQRVVLPEYGAPVHITPQKK